MRSGAPQVGAALETLGSQSPSDRRRSHPATGSGPGTRIEGNREFLTAPPIAGDVFEIMMRLHGCGI
jgi:hypothetical protein